MSNTSDDTSQDDATAEEVSSADESPEDVPADDVPAEDVPAEVETGKLEGDCIHCQRPMGHLLGVQSPSGPIHNDCVPAYNKDHVERCKHCDLELLGKIITIRGERVHAGCAEDFKAKKPYVRPTKIGVLRKFSVGRSIFGSKNWKERYFVLSPKIEGLAYFETQEDYAKGVTPKGFIKFTDTTRLVQKPSRDNHAQVLNPSKDLVLIFKDDNAGKELVLLMAASTWQEHDEWTNALKAYLKIVDHPDDVPKLI